MPTKPTLQHVETPLTPDEQSFLERARGKFLENTDWLEFEEFAFGSRSPIFSRTRLHRDVVQHPLYIALKQMWLDLGVRQGRVADPDRGETNDGPRRKASGGR